MARFTAFTALLVIFLLVLFLLVQGSDCPPPAATVAPSPCSAPAGISCPTEDIGLVIVGADTVWSCVWTGKGAVWLSARMDVAFEVSP